MIWEATWQEPRVMEIRERWHSMDSESDSESDSDSDSDSDLKLVLKSDAGHYIGLRLAGSLSRFIASVDTSIGTRTTSYETFENCPAPVSLQICCESRTHTPRHFTCMVDSITDYNSFYFNSRRDFLWLSIDEGAGMVAQLKQHYGTQLAQIRNFLPQEVLWRGGHTLLGYYSTYLNIFEGIRWVRILLDGFEGDNETPIKPQEYPHRAKELALRDLKELENDYRGWTIDYTPQTGRSTTSSTIKNSNKISSNLKVMDDWLQAFQRQLKRNQLYYTKQKLRCFIRYAQNYVFVSFYLHLYSLSNRSIHSSYSMYHHLHCF